MNIKVGDTVEHLYHMSNKGEVIKVYYVNVTAGSGGGGPLSKATRVVFKSQLDDNIYDMPAKDLRLVRE